MIKLTITDISHTDNIRQYNVTGTFNFTMNEEVIYIPNGLMFNVENNRMWKWMTESGKYIKIISYEER